MIRLRLLLKTFSVLIICALCVIGEAQTKRDKIIGTISQTPASFVCYFVAPADINKKSNQRKYLFVSDEQGKALMRLDGEDVPLENGKTIRKSNKRFVESYSANKMKISLDKTVTKKVNDGEAVYYDATITVRKNEQTEVVQAKGFCGD